MRFVGLLVLTLLLPTSVSCATLININTADSTALQTLSGIGPSKATAIIAYRTDHGPFARIEDIQNVSGIGPSTYAGIQDFITVRGDAAPVVATSTPATPSVGATTYVPPPSSLVLDIDGPETVTTEVPLHYTARVTTKNGAADPTAQIRWSFGDGSAGQGGAVEKVYRYPGTYLLTVEAVDGSASARTELTVSATRALLHLLPLTSEGIIVANDADTRLDLSLWYLRTETGSFRIPAGTVVLPKTSVLFPFSVMNMPIAFTATLTYPSGILAARVVPETSVVASTTLSVAVPVPSVRPTVTIARTSQGAAAPERAAAPSTSPGEVTQPTAVANSPATSLFHSPWTIAFAGLMTLAAAGAFIFL